MPTIDTSILGGTSSEINRSPLWKRRHPWRISPPGFFIGHGTGCGKGLICALIILANWCEGRKKAIWISKNETLIEDARRDWQRLGGKPTQIVPLSKYKLGESIGLSEGILFVTYGGLRTQVKTARNPARTDPRLVWAQILKARSA